MIVFPNAKINLGLYVTEKRSDGFHNIETVFYPIPLNDVLEIIEAPDSSDEIQLFNHGLQIDAPSYDNLVVRAIRLLKNDFSIPNLTVHLLKKIPFGAGLGGGSSDAAYALKLLNDKFQLGLSLEQLEDYARKLGSDCAFFIRNECVFAYNKGDVFETINLSLKGFKLLLVHPNIHVSTAEAYSKVSVGRPHPDLRKVGKIPLADWQSQIANDFEISVFAKYPQLALLKENLLSKGAAYASMSGSGSSVFGIFEATTLAENLEQINQFLQVTFEDFRSFVLDL